MRNEDVVRARMAKLIVLRDGMTHPAHENEQRALTAQINELAWMVELMEDAGAGALLPANETAQFPPLDLLLHERDVEDKVRSITDYMYHESGQAGSHEAQSLILSRVAQNLVQSMVIERQTDWTKVSLGFARPTNGEVRSSS